MPVVATAGHVDHGKSTLVHALTGIDPDRWEAEKVRGLTIDLGFAWRTLPSGVEVAFVDVPGHSRFISNMLAGVGAVDACMFIVDSSEGWKPQSEEHLRILDVLGLSLGVVVLTKAALVDDDTAELVRLEVADRVGGTFLESAPVVTVDALTGAGLDELVATLDAVLAGAPDATEGGRPRLWVDRVFAARGAGTVVTGTLTGGSLRVHDELVVEPHGTAVRVRGLQSHKQQVDVTGAGRRVAVNLTGTSHHDIARGDALVRPAQWFRTTTLDCTLSVVPGLEHNVTRRGAYHAHVGAGEYAVRVRVLGAEAIVPGATGVVRVHLPVALPLVRGDHYVLRESGRGETVGGGEVLDVDPVLPASRARPDRSLDRVIAERGWTDAADLERLTGERVAPTVGRWVAAGAAIAAVEARLRAALDSDGVLDVSQLDEREAAVLARIEGISVDNGRARWATTPATDWGAHPYVAALAASPYNPPPPDGVDRAELRELVRAGLVVDCDGEYFASAAVDRAGSEIARLLQLHPDGVTVAIVRDALGTTRKHALPLLARLDATGVTRRRGDLRVGGPRLPQRVE